MYGHLHGAAVFADQQRANKAAEKRRAAVALLGMGLMAGGVIATLSMVASWLG